MIIDELSVGEMTEDKVYMDKFTVLKDVCRCNDKMFLIKWL